jgi:hypothetical protein
MKKSYVIALAVLALATTGVVAEETDVRPGKAAQKTEQEIVTQDMTVIGIVTKCENKKKDGTAMMTWFNLIDEEGKEVRLPKGKVEEFTGVKVKVSGAGYNTEKRGKPVRVMKSITTIEKVEIPAK